MENEENVLKEGEQLQSGGNGEMSNGRKKKKDYLIRGKGKTPKPPNLEKILREYDKQVKKILRDLGGSPKRRKPPRKRK